MRAAKIILFLWVLLFAAPAFAQTDNLKIVDCYVNTTAYTFAAGQAGLVACDTQGRLIISPQTSPQSVTATPAVGTCTDTPRTLPAGTSTTLLTAGTYKSVSYMDIGTNPATFTEGTAAAVVGNGMALSGAQAAGYGGGFYSYTTPPTNAVQGISTSGTTIIVKVCN